MTYKYWSDSMLSRSDIYNLAQILKIPLNYYSENKSPLYQDFVKKLGAIVGLGFVPIIVDGGSVSSYQRHLEIFLNHRDFQDHPECIQHLSLALAEMISWSTFIYSLLGYPKYYTYFVQSVKKLLNDSISGLYGDVEEILKLKAKELQELFH